MKKRYKNTFADKLLNIIEDLPGVVVLREDIALLGSPRQISRGLKTLCEDGKLIKIGFGVYAKAYISPYINVPVIRSDFTQACIETLERLNIKWEPSQNIKDYNAGRSQQVPRQFEIRLKSRFRRKLAYGKQILRIEGMIYAK